MLADKDEFFYAALLKFVSGRCEKRGENALAAKIRVYHADEFFFLPAVAIRFKIARQLPIDIIQEIVAFVAAPLAQHVHANAHSQPVMRIAYLDQARDCGEIVRSESRFCDEVVFALVRCVFFHMSFRSSQGICYAIIEHQMRDYYYHYAVLLFSSILSEVGIEHVIVNMPDAHELRALETFGKEIIP